MKNRDRVINARDLIDHILKNIVFALIFVALGIVLLVAFCFLKNGAFRIGNSFQPHNSGVDAESLYSSLPYNDQIMTDVAINDFEDYYYSYVLLNNSIIERVNSYNALKLSLVYSVDFTGNDAISEEEVRMINQYSMMLYYYGANGSLAQDVSEKTGIETTCIQDCISMNTYAEDSGILNLDVYGTEVETDLEGAIIESMDAYIQDKTQNANINIVLIKQNATFVRVSWIFQSQRDWEAEQTRIKSRLDTAVAALSPDAYECFKIKASTEYPEFFESVYPENVTIISNSAITPKTIIKYAVIGAIVGFVLYVAYVMILFMYSKKIITISDYSDTMGLKILGSVTNANKDMDIIATKILASCNKQLLDEIIIISTNVDGTKESIDLLSKKLKENGLKVESSTSFMSDYKEMGALLRIGNCVIVEKINSSLYSSVYDEVDLCKENSVNILGLVNIAK